MTELLPETAGSRVGPSVDVAGARWPAGARLLTSLLVASVPLAVIEPGATPWLLAGVLGLVASRTVGQGTKVAPAVDALQRHMMSCRRRGEHANVLVMAIEPATSRSIAALLAATRATDTFVVHRSRDGAELHALLDGDVPDREVVERRLAGRLDPDVGCAFGWAVFPDDGLTLDVLFEAAHVAVPGDPTGTPHGAARLARMRR